MDEIMIDDDGRVRGEAVGLPVYEHEPLSLEDEVQLDGLVYMPTPHDEAMMTHCLGYAQTWNSLFKYELQSRVMKVDIPVLSHGFLLFMSESSSDGSIYCFLRAHDGTPPMDMSFPVFSEC